MKLHYQTTGNPFGTPLVFFHGFMGNYQDWESVIRNMDGDYFCVMIDLYGHGESLGQTDYGFERLIDDLQELFEELGVKTVVLAGYSMGARLAMQVAWALSDWVSGLIMESGTPGLLTQGERAERWRSDCRLAQQLKTQGMSAFLESWYSLPLFHSLTLQPALHQELKQQRMHNDSDELALALLIFSVARQPSLWEHLPFMDFPVLVLAGALDSKYVSLARRMAEWLPRGELAIVESAGHNVHLEQPAAYVAAVNQFLNQITC